MSNGISICHIHDRCDAVWWHVPGIMIRILGMNLVLWGGPSVCQLACTVCNCHIPVYSAHRHCIMHATIYTCILCMYMKYSCTGHDDRSRVSISSNRKLTVWSQLYHATCITCTMCLWNQWWDVNVHVQYMLPIHYKQGSPTHAATTHAVLLLALYGHQQFVCISCRWHLSELRYQHYR